ncbi:LysR family transcriptional regulator [Pseudooceanicola nanhaiensis]|nr:LysR family transcriptional regulator [Pseudooceanicola nanhaiensis]MCA0920757.1 LysR family transcriptional regulator [Pseudooceanicola nanhaiensis]
MNLRQLEVFRAVIQGGSTKNAAEMLLVSQPAVSNMVRQL